MASPRDACLAARRHRARCTRCQSRSGPFAERTSECGCAVLYCDACREDPGFPDAPGVPQNRLSSEAWLFSYARLHAWRFVAERAADRGDETGCGDCHCRPPEPMIKLAEAERRAEIELMRRNFLANPTWDVRYPEGRDVPEQWRREAWERVLAMARTQAASPTEAEDA